MLSRSSQRLGMGGAILALSMGLGTPQSLEAENEKKKPAILDSFFQKKHAEIQKCSREGISFIFESMKGAVKYCADKQGKKGNFDCKLNMKFDFTDEAAERRENGQNFSMDVSTIEGRCDEAKSCIEDKYARNIKFPKSCNDRNIKIDYTLPLSAY